MKFHESEIEDLFVEHLAELGWESLHGREIAPGATWTDASGNVRPNRESWADVVIPSRVRQSVHRLNPGVPTNHLDLAVAELLRPQSSDAIAENKRLHDAIVDGIRHTYIDDDGIERTPTIRIVDLHEAVNNTFLAVRQVTVRTPDLERRFDVVLYLNGLPLVIAELKDASNAAATLDTAHAQIATYVREFPTAFRAAAVSVISDGVTARYGTPFTSLNHYSPWNVDADGTPRRPEGAEAAADGVTAPLGEVETAAEVALAEEDFAYALEQLTDGLLAPERLLELLDGFVAFDSGEGGLVKRVAKPHQIAAVRAAVEATVTAVAGDGRAGVVWHTQGSGKSMEMELYAAKILKHPALRNPTIVVVTDRTELDGQLYETFARSELLPEKPEQVTSRATLRQNLSARRTGGIYFTTLQKFGLSKAERDAGAAHPRLSDRRNIVLIVDEAHRSHYEDLDGYAWHLKNALPGATLIAFTGTPISFADRDTRAVFGEVIHTYDLTQAVVDGATVPVYFEPRLLKVEQSADLSPEEVDELADEITAGIDDVERARIEQGVARVNAVYGAPQRLEVLAREIVEHWEARREAMAALVSGSEPEKAPGKALVVAATREICARLYDEIVALRPEWHAEADSEGVIKVVYSGTASDTAPVVDHVRRESANRAIRQRLTDPADPLEIVIVKDMLLTGFDAPPLHTLYLDRPMKGALLMQTLARVNRTFRRKNAGLLVASAPVTENLAAALAEYTVSDQETRPVGRTVEDAVALVHEALAAAAECLVGFDWRTRLRDAKQSRDFLRAVMTTASWLRTPRPGADPEAPSPSSEFRTAAGQLQRAWALAGRQEELEAVRGDVQFLSAVRVVIGKLDTEERRAAGLPIPAQIEVELAGLVARSVASGEVLSIYEAAGLEPVRIDTFERAMLDRLRAQDDHQLAIEQLRNLVMSESRSVARGNLVRQRAFSERLDEIMARYTNANLTSAEVMSALFELGEEIFAEGARGAEFDPPLSNDELAFYDAVASNPSAVELQGTDTLATIARELVIIMRRDAKTDWGSRDDVKAKLRSSVKRLLVKYRYPPDQQPGAVTLVIDQMEQLAAR
ncbi:DEAD/DEAH box helicase [Serinibacter arcticus]|uniref:Type I restriction enzyme endonuclease subunit n=1 Tax=Serinibacter arcticus TaxID=1655435 RepID=A0A2U1ZUQ5_9MICO|nr:type I restriction endonuclease subunit R [Serinibacter arcticus]PWD50680.1 DEAD/DEAH box helicase [Serinibacter arcticus]